MESPTTLVRVSVPRVSMSVGDPVEGAYDSNSETPVEDS